MTTCALCPRELGENNLCHHGRFLCIADCIDHCTPEDDQ